mmetsp:Transcript_4825/g.14945  ORF Transcript_4825/g.14945 Transcript_4825/m.14945 type:complete len:201 (+) Transcript_4825:17-619(+)
MRGKSLRGITFARFQQREPYALAKSWSCSKRSTLLRMMCSLWFTPESEVVRHASVSPVVPGLSGSKKRSTTSARSASHRTTPRKSYPRSVGGARSSERGLASRPSSPRCASAARVAVCGLSIMPGESTSIRPSTASPDRTLSCTWLRRPGPKTRSGEKPKSGSPTNDGPSRSASAVPGAITVKQSSVGATPVCCTVRPST